MTSSESIIGEGEQDESAVVRFFQTTAADGKQCEVEHYSLDMVLTSRCMRRV